MIQISFSEHFVLHKLSTKISQETDLKVHEYTARNMSIKLKKNKTGDINDPLGQTHSLMSRSHCFGLIFVLF